MKGNKEELYPMEIRVIIDLPKDIFDEYSDLKRKRKLTHRVQKAITTYERDYSKGGHGFPEDRVNKLEDAILQMSNMMNRLIENTVTEREERKKEIELVKEQLQSQNKMIDDLMKKMGDLVVVKTDSVEKTKEDKGETVQEAKVEVVEKDTTETSEVNSVNNEEDLEKKLLEQLEALRAAKKREEDEVRKPPSKQIRNKLASMMDI